MILASLLSSIFGIQKPGDQVTAPAQESPQQNVQQQLQRSPAPPQAPASTSTLAATVASSSATGPYSFEPRPYTPLFSQRSLRQLGLYAGGAGFLMLSTLITKRAVNRQQVKSQMKFFYTNLAPAGKSPSGGPKPSDGKDALVAVEALGLATLNVISFGVMMTGGMAWALDVSGLEDMRYLARKTLGVNGVGGSADDEAEQEISIWVAQTLKMAERKVADKGKGGEAPKE